MNKLHTIGRWMFVIPFIIFGVFHLTSPGQLAPLVPSFFPGSGSFWVVVTGIIFIAAAVGIAFHKYEKEASILLGLQLVIFALTVWAPQISGESAAFAFPNLLKDTMLAGAAFAFAGLAAKERKHEMGKDSM